MKMIYICFVLIAFPALGAAQDSQRQIPLEAPKNEIEISEKVLNQYKETFEIFDMDHDGFITNADADKFYTSELQNPTYLRTLTIQQILETRIGLYNIIKEHNGRLELKDYAKFMIENDTSHKQITIDDIYQLQGRNSYTVENLAKKWKMEPKQLLTSLGKKTLSDMVTPDEFFKFVSKKPTYTKGTSIFTPLLKSILDFLGLLD